MRWREGRESTNIDDRRGRRVPMKAVGGGIGGIIVLVIALLFGVDPGVVLDGGTNTGAGPAPPLTQEEQELGQFVSVVLADTEDTWNALFAEEGLDYREPTLVLFTDAVESECGVAESAIGPFYCPIDENIYIDLSFYRDLKNRYGAPGDFAQAYVIAHEVGHHVQNQLGTMEDVQAAQERSSQVEANRLSVMLELQADCFSGVWAHNADRTRDILEQGDVEEALNAASSIGDDRLTQGRVSPDSFTHGTSEQRVSWFKTGLESGTIESCNTFEVMG
jgi:predicted metalloprotease